MKDSPLVSIIVPNYNGAEFLEECIDSVISQTYKNWELIICDDNSTDGSLEIVCKYKDKRILPPIALKKNQGAAVARNLCIETAKGELLAFLDNDDFWHPEKLKKQVDFMIRNAFDFTYTDYIQFSDSHKKIVRCKERVSKRVMLRNNYILTSTVMYNASSIGKVYMSNIRKRQDWSLFMNILNKSAHAYNLTEPLTHYRKHPKSLSNKKLGLLGYTFDFYHKVLGYGKIMAVFMLVQYLFHYFIKKIKEIF
ncbi:glycosyltransferase family 2 protein [Allomuricauda sp. SCSIO 65647]|uniref:glycosyltransferase family 2 protein n=1 Tax=Allomuricauda sp. SCSIO 65647 TaxID=2908843 RepID=UPI001F4901B8|nr:glycosyltransferase family 2 protein [Muricauda sp. SCSIO 65647]UJH69042.1 glycosyltransferase family 2 protein [Muricauda sp. SCSIO 65647]